MVIQLGSQYLIMPKKMRECDLGLMIEVKDDLNMTYDMAKKKVCALIIVQIHIQKCSLDRNVSYINYISAILQ